MTILVDVKVQPHTGGNNHLTILRLSAYGVSREGVNVEPGRESRGHTVYKGNAVLLVEGYADLTDGTPEDEQWTHDNPLDDFLKREHPAMAVQQELMQRLQSAEETIARLREENTSLRTKVGAAKSALQKIND